MVHPSTIKMGNEVKEVVIRDLSGYFKWVVVDGFVLADERYLDELFSQELCRA